MEVQTFDQAKAETFAAKMIAMLNDASLTLMVSIGHQVGLFDTLAKLPPSTSEQIATAAALHERYVREWLGAMVTGGIVDYDPANGTYALPPEHAGSLTRAAGSNNLAVLTQYVPIIAQVESNIIECFRNGGGVPYSAYPRLQQVMREDTGAVHDATLLSAVVPLVPGLEERLRAGIEVADVGCGSGHAINVLASAFPNSRFVGYDLSEDGIAAARREAAAMGLGNARFEVRDASTLDVRDRFGLITAFDAIHDQARPGQVLARIADALRPDGVFLMVDFRASRHVHENSELVLAPFLYTISCMHCTAVSLGQNGPGLGAMWGEAKALELLAEAGFRHVDVKHVEGDPVNNYYVATKG